jgi:hypothetical protein
MKQIKTIFVAIIVCVLWAGTSATWPKADIHSSANKLQNPVSLRCEYLTNPVGIDVTDPQLSWMLESEIRGQKKKNS